MLSQTFALSLLTSDINDAKNGFYICYDVLSAVCEFKNAKTLWHEERGGTNMNSPALKYARRYNLKSYNCR